MSNNLNILWSKPTQSWLKFQSPNSQSNYYDSPSLTSKQLKQFYQKNKKLDNPSKGSLCYTENGYGIIQNINSNGIYEIKLKDQDKIINCQKNQIKFEMPLRISVLFNNIIINSAIVINLNSKISEISSKINEALSEQFKGGECQAIIYNGKELSKYQDQEISVLGINHNSRFLAINPTTKLYKLTRYAKRKQDSWYYSNNSTDGVSFSVSKDIQIAGMGLFTTNTEIDFQVKLVEGEDANGEALSSRLITNSRDSGDIIECLFDKPVKLIQGNQYSLVQIAQKSGNGFYGEEAQPNQEMDNGIIISFKSCLNADNGTGFNFKIFIILIIKLEATRGQIAEIYFYA